MITKKEALDILNSTEIKALKTIVELHSIIERHEETTGKVIAFLEGCEEKIEDKPCAEEFSNFLEGFSDCTCGYANQTPYGVKQKTYYMIGYELGRLLVEER